MFISDAIARANAAMAKKPGFDTAAPIMASHRGMTWLFIALGVTETDYPLELANRNWHRSEREWDEENYARFHPELVP